MSKARAPRAPAGLGPAGRKLWRAVTERVELEPWEVPVLVQACGTADAIAELEDAMAGEPLIVDGVVHRGVGELRRQRETLSKLLRSLSWPSDEAAGSRAGQKLAQHRWRPRAVSE